MLIHSRRSTRSWALVPVAAAFLGCGNEEIKLQDAPAVAIPAAKTDAVSKNKAALEKGAPPPGSSAGLNQDPSQIK